MALPNLAVLRDPLSKFGSLLKCCIRDEYESDRKGTLTEGVAFVVLGLLSSLLTTVVLSQLGLLLQL
jgi:hypothetical protein